MKLSNLLRICRLLHHAYAAYYFYSTRFQSVTQCSGCCKFRFFNDIIACMESTASDGSALTATLGKAPVNGTVTIQTDGTFTYPDQADDPYQGGTPLNQWTVDRDGVLIATAGHLHPGGLHTDLWVTRGDQTAHAFRSDAQYFEPAGAVSWDVAMTATTPDWHVAVQAGDVLSTTATYDSALASWYESMGIMVVWMGELGWFQPSSTCAQSTSITSLTTSTCTPNWVAPLPVI